MAKIGELVVGITADVSGLTKGIDSAQGKIGGMGKAMQFMQGPMAVVGAVGDVFGKVADAVREAEAAFAASEKASAILNATLKATGAEAWTSATKIEKMAASLQDTTGYADDAIVSMSNVLLGFKNIKGDNFTEATSAILDMATVMNMDLTSAAQAVGKALDDPIAGIGALSRQGFRFSDEQKAMLATMVQTGDIAGAQKIILDELATTYGGAAEAAGGLNSALDKRLANKMDDLNESIGEFFTNVLADSRRGGEVVLGQFKDFFDGLNDMINPAKAMADALTELTDGMDMTRFASSGMFDAMTADTEAKKLSAEQIERLKKLYPEMSEKINLNTATMKEAAEAERRILEERARFELGNIQLIEIGQRTRSAALQKEADALISQGLLWKDAQGNMQYRKGWKESEQAALRFIEIANERVTLESSANKLADQRVKIQKELSGEALKEREAAAKKEAADAKALRDAEERKKLADDARKKALEEAKAIEDKWKRIEAIYLVNEDMLELTKSTLALRIEENEALATSGGFTEEISRKWKKEKADLEERIRLLQEAADATKEAAKHATDPKIPEISKENAHYAKFASQAAKEKAEAEKEAAEHAISATDALNSAASITQALAGFGGDFGEAMSQISGDIGKLGGILSDIGSGDVLGAVTGMLTMMITAIVDAVNAWEEYQEKVKETKEIQDDFYDSWDKGSLAGDKIKASLDSNLESIDEYIAKLVELKKETYKATDEYKLLQDELVTVTKESVNGLIEINAFFEKYRLTTEATQRAEAERASELADLMSFQQTESDKILAQEEEMLANAESLGASEAELGAIREYWGNKYTQTLEDQNQAILDAENAKIDAYWTSQTMAGRMEQALEAIRVSPRKFVDSWLTDAYQQMQISADQAVDLFAGIGTSIADGITQGMIDGMSSEEIKDSFRKSLISSALEAAVFSSGLKSQFEQLGFDVAKATSDGLDAGEAAAFKTRIENLAGQASTMSSAISGLVNSAFGYSGAASGSSGGSTIVQNFYTPVATAADVEGAAMAGANYASWASA